MDAFFATPFWFQAGVITALGLCVGSFLNVVIYRVPVMLERDFQAWARETLAEAAPAQTAPAQAAADPEPFNLLKPDSHCPGCSAPVRAWQNIPILSWILLRGRCAGCGTAISVRYPLVELATAAASLLTVMQLGSDTAAAWFALPCIWTLIALSMIDFDHQILPDSMTYPLLWGGLLISLGNVYVDAPTAIVGAAAGYLCLWSVYWAFKLTTGKEGMGYGDFKLLAAAGAWTGWMALPYLLLIASIAGLLIQGAIILVGSRGREQPFAFGPYIAVAFAIVLLFREELARYAALPLY